MKHIFWLEHYPRSISGIIDYLSCSEEVHCICAQSSIYTKRAKMGWGKDNLEKVSFTYLKDGDIHSTAEYFINDDPEVIHYIMGVRYGKMGHIVKRYLLNRKDLNIFVLAERPYLYGKSKIEQFLLACYYYYIGFKYSNNIKGVFAMGTLGVKAYRNWAKGRVFPFLYPHFNKIEVKSTECSKPIKALYVGQLDKRKGIDLLIDVMPNFDGLIELSVVGSNGNVESEIIHKIKECNNIKYNGVWDSEQLREEITDYDVCIVPSRYDGWGMFVMEGIEAGLGVITTDKTGSKDLIEASKAGIIIHSDNKDSLNIALYKIAYTPTIVDEWKQYARQYRNRICQNVVGDYFRECINYSLNLSQQLPICPWL